MSSPSTSEFLRELIRSGKLDRESYLAATQTVYHLERAAEGLSDESLIDWLDIPADVIEQNMGRSHAT